MRPAARFASSAVLAASVIGAASAAVLDLPVTIYDNYKIVELNIGNPSKTYRFTFDTGSASTWMVDSECAATCSHVDRGNRTGYDIDASSTGQPTGQYTVIDYLGGRVAGSTVQDDFSTEGLTWNGTFIAANESDWSSLPVHGFLGLAFGSIADGGAQPVFETLMERNLVDEPRFSIYYARDEGTDTGGVPGKGLLTLGGSKEEEYIEGNLSTIRLTTRKGVNDIWRSVLHSTTGTTKASDGTEIKTETDLAWADVVFDTGAPSISLPTNKLEEVYRSIGMNWTAIIKGHHIPLCSEFTDAWSISFEVGLFGETKTLTLTGDQLALPGFAGREDGCWPPFDDSGADGLTLIGARLLRNFYTIWNYGSFPQEGPISPTLSFGKLKAGL
ncbi:hypothetical protein F66182_2560 [Fusarium sp. NRRL 66182]|nr:hypothetical protein F66182_2560 [Fusarium sp. NRRL 66182]